MQKVRPGKNHRFINVFINTSTSFGWCVFKENKSMKLAFELSEDEALALAQFVKRVGWKEMRECAVDDNEAYIIRNAVNSLREALAYCGFNPR